MSRPHRRGRARRGPAIGRRLATMACAVLALAAFTAPPATAASPTTAVSSQRAAVAPTPISGTAPDPVQAVLDQLVTEGATGAMALVDDGERTWRLASGVARIRPHRELDPDLRFRVGSMTKTFVATVALQAVADGRLRLDDPVDRWVPGLVPDGGTITLRMLLNHTSGLFNYTSTAEFQRWATTTPTRPSTPQDLVALATGQPATFPPGQGWSYSNTGYLVAGLMIEAATGRDIEDLVREGIIEPLGLTDTSFPERSPRIPGKHIHGYLPPRLTGAGYLDVSKISPTLTWAAGAMVSTLDDVRRFYAALLQGHLLPPAMLEQMLTTVPVDVGHRYGLGIESLDLACGTVWGHNGSIPGYASLSYHDRDGGRGAVLLMSTRADAALAPLYYGAALQTAACQAFGHAPGPQPTSAALAPSALLRDVG